MAKRRVEAYTQAFPKHPKAPKQALSSYLTGDRAELIDRYDACAILVDKRPSGALSVL